MAPLRLLLAFSLLCLMAPAHAAPVNDPLAWTLDEREIQQPVDSLTWCLDCNGVDWTTGEPWVVNPTTCMWDTDDEFTYLGAGILGAGVTTSITECLYLSGQSVAASTWISSPSPELAVTYAFTWPGGGYSVSVPGVWDKASRVYLYRACIRSPFLQGGEPIEVPDSHGGIARPVTITVTVGNPTGHEMRRTGGRISFGWIPWFGDCF